MSGKIARNGIVVGLGGNVGGLPVLQQRFLSVIEELSESFGRARVSSGYVSKPVGPVREQPDFLNAVAVWNPPGERDSHELLAILQSIENSHGRTRSVTGGARTLDLDLLFHGQEVCVGRELRLPHPRLLSRVFVLQPLVDIFGEEFVPQGSERTLRDLLASAKESGQKVRLYFPGHESSAPDYSSVCLK